MFVSTCVSFLYTRASLVKFSSSGKYVLWFWVVGSYAGYDLSEIIFQGYTYEASLAIVFVGYFVL